MKKKFEVTIPLKIESEGNKHGHHMARYARLKKHTGIIKLMLGTCRIKLPCTVTMTRIAPRELDEHDNLRSALKHVVDCVSDHLIPGLKAGRADGSKDIKWEYRQAKGRPLEYALTIKIEEQNE